MSFKFCSIASGSKGNCYVVATEKTKLLIDVGISGKKIFESLKEIDISPEEIDGILVSHEHIDHVRSVKVIMKKSNNAKVYSNIGTWEYIKDKTEEKRQVIFETEKEFAIGDILIYPFSTSHDAVESVGFSLSAAGKKVSILTDTGCVTEGIFQAVKDSDLLALEANHDEEILRFCSYPYSIKRRILGARGHLSNEVAGKFLCRILEEVPKNRKILLAHLSKENNTPEMAKLTIENMLDEKEARGEQTIHIDVLSPSQRSRLFYL